MFKLLQKYKQWLLCFLAGLLLVVLPSVVFAQEVPALTSNTDITVQELQAQVQERIGFYASHSEPNFYE